VSPLILSFSFSFVPTALATTHTHHRTRLTPAGELREKIGWFPISFVEFIIEDDDVVEEGEDAEVVPISSNCSAHFIRYLLVI
jgi:hypothetical protein